MRHHPSPLPLSDKSSRLHSRKAMILKRQNKPARMGNNDVMDAIIPWMSAFGG